MVRVAGAFSRRAKGLYRPYQIYRSAAGKSLVAKQPPLAGKSVEMSQEAMLRLMPQIIAIAMTAESAAEVVPPAHLEAVKERVAEAAPAVEVPAGPVGPEPSKASGVSAVFGLEKPEMLMLLWHDGQRVSHPRRRPDGHKQRRSVLVGGRKNVGLRHPFQWRRGRTKRCSRIAITSCGVNNLLTASC